MVAMALEILCLRSVMSRTFVRFQDLSRYPKEEVEWGVSGERSGDGIGPSLAIHRSGTACS